MRRLFAVLLTTFALLVTSIFAMTSAQAATTQSGATCTITGTAGADTLVGTEGNDVICGLGGRDTITGGGGNDIIDGGAGADTISGEAGKDTIQGGLGADLIDGGTEKDFIRAGDGADTVTGGAGDDGIIGGGGTDTLDGGEGDNLCDGSVDGDIINNCGFDEEGPRVVDYTTDVSSVNTANAAKVVTFRIHVTDDLMGTKYVTCDLYNGTLSYTGGGDMATRISGNGLDGVWQCQTNVPKYGTPGKWYVNISAEDNTGSINYYGSMTESSEEFAFSKQCEADGLGGSVNQTWRCANAVGPLYVTQSGRGDLAPPALVAVSSSKSAVNTSAGPVTVTIKASLTDDLSGIKWVSCDLIHSDGMSIWSESGPVWTPTLGTAQSGIYTCTLTMPRASAPGDWTVRITAEDRTKKQTYYDTSTKITQRGAGDLEPPVALSITASKTAVNTSLAARSFTVSMNLKDDYSGIPTDGNHVMAYLTHGSTTIGPAPQPIGLSCTRMSATGQCKEGVWTVTFTLPKGSARGAWGFNLEIRDFTNRYQPLLYDAETNSYRGSEIKGTQTLLPPVVITNG